jgi:hypothetical protein
MKESSVVGDATVTPTSQFGWLRDIKDMSSSCGRKEAVTRTLLRLKGRLSLSCLVIHSVEPECAPIQDDVLLKQ